MVIAQAFGEGANQGLSVMGIFFAEGVNVYEMCSMFALWEPKALIRDSDVTGEFLRRKCTALRGVARYPSNRALGSDCSRVWISQCLAMAYFQHYGTVSVRLSAMTHFSLVCVIGFWHV